MGFQYGIGICEETLHRLSSSDGSIDYRLGRAFSEIDVIEPEDVTPEHYERIDRWKARYLSREEMIVTPDGSLVELDETEEENRLVSDLENLCADIIEKNTAAENES